MDTVILTAQQLSKEGKVPTTALLKARLPKNTPLPKIIQGLKEWKLNPQQAADRANKSATNTFSDSEDSDSFDALIDARIEHALKPFISQINALKADIAALQKQLTTEDKN